MDAVEWREGEKEEAEEREEAIGEGCREEEEEEEGEIRVRGRVEKERFCCDTCTAVIFLGEILEFIYHLKILYILINLFIYCVCDSNSLERKTNYFSKWIKSFYLYFSNINIFQYILGILLPHIRVFKIFGEILRQYQP